MAIPILLRRQVEERDAHRCSYCQTAEENCGLRMHIDHIIPETKQGPTKLDNLCLACFTCNVYKCDQQTGIDPLTGAEFALFHPIQESWTEHFVWDESGTLILGLTPQGRATVVTLQMNNLTVVQARRRWVSAGWHHRLNDEKILYNKLMLESEAWPTKPSPNKPLSTISKAGPRWRGYFQKMRL